MKRKGTVAYTLVVMLIAIVTITVVLRLDTTVLAWLRGGAEDQRCVTSTLVSSLTSTGGHEVYSIDCPPKYVTIVMKKGDVKGEEVKGEYYEDIDKTVPKYRVKSLKKWYDSSRYGWIDDLSKGTGASYLEYNMDEIFAKEMKSCWNKLGRGELNLFDQWHKVIGYGEGNFKANDGIIMKFIKGLKVWNIEGRSAPKVCVLCSRVRFDEGVVKAFKGKEITSLTDWMMHHPVSTVTSDPISYYEFLKDDAYQSDYFLKKCPEGDEAAYCRPDLKYDLGKEWAVVYSRTNLHYLTSLSNGIVSGLDLVDESDLPEAMDMIFLMPYGEVSEQCDDFQG